jgi:transposase
MLSLEEDVEAVALHRQGWRISAIARHLGRDRKTIRAYIAGTRVPGKRRPRAAVTAFAPFEPYVRARLAEDPHVWATALLDEARRLGYTGSYARFTAGIRDRELRPRCEACQGVKGRATIDIAHPPGDEIQWDIVDVSGAPWGEATVHILVGSLAYSGRTRAVVLDGQTFGHIVAGIDAVLRKLGGTARTWRFDRMAVVCTPSTGEVTPAFARVAKHYGVRVAVCPPRRGNRKGVVEKRNHVLAQRWWRTAADIGTPSLAQISLDRFLAGTAEEFERHGGTVAEAAAAERLLPLPAAAYPAVIEDDRVVDAQALVAWAANRYAVPPNLVGAVVLVRQVIGTDVLAIALGDGREVARHQVVAGSGRIVRTPEQRRELELVVLEHVTTAAPCRRKDNRPPGPAARAAAAALRGDLREAAEVTVDLERYAAAAGA